MLFGPNQPKRFAIFLSGAGSTFQSIIEVQGLHQPALVISNKTNANGLLRARRFGLPIYTIDENTSIEQINSILKFYKIDFIFLAGYMKLLKKEFIENYWYKKTFNIHPSILPKFKGLNAAERSWKQNFQMGVSIHEVVAEVDSGTIKLQNLSLNKNHGLNLKESLCFLRSTEQSSLRNFFLRILK
jgi:phosphoribosylglycinamide formyltransferase-1